MASFLPEGASWSAMLAGVLVTAIFIAGLTIDCILLTSIAKWREVWDEKCRRLRERPWNGNDVLHMLLVMGSVFAAMILASQMMHHCCIILSDNAERLLMLGETLFMQGVAIATIAMLRNKHNRSVSDCFSRSPSGWARDLRQGVLLYLAMMPLVIASAVLANLVLQGFNMPVESQDILKGFADPTAPLWFRVYLIGMAVFLAPLVEESAFRGIALPVATKYATPTAAIITVSVLFALIHGHVPAAAPLFVIAVGFSVAYIYSESILVPITMHALFNATNLVIFYLSYDMTQI
jgi:membrane protease YdiL (CAAX protease family)